MNLVSCSAYIFCCFIFGEQNGIGMCRMNELRNSTIYGYVCFDIGTRKPKRPHGDGSLLLAGYKIKLLLTRDVSSLGG